MLRTLFVLAIILFLLRYSVRGPFYALLLYLWVAYFRPEQWVWGGLIESLPLSSWVGGFVVTAAVLSGQAFRIDGRLLLLLALLGQSLASTLSSDYVDYSWPYWIDFLKSTAITYLIAVLTTDLHKLRLVFLTIALSLGFEAARQGWGQLILVPGQKNYNSHVMLGDENGVAVGMFMLLPLIVALFQTSRVKWARHGYVVLLVGVIYRGISTFSRGGLLTALAVATLYIIRSQKKLMAMAVTATLALAIAPILSDAFWARMSTIGLPPPDPETAVEEVQADIASTSNRLHYWGVALIMAERHPFLGVGHNAYNAAFDRYDPAGGEYGTGRSVHSAWLGMLSELGFPGLILFVTSLTLAFTTCHRVRRRAKTEAVMRQFLPYAIALETSLVAFAVGGTFVIFHYNEMLWHFVGLAIALHRVALTADGAGAEASSAHGRLSSQVADRNGAEAFVAHPAMAALRRRGPQS